MFGNTYIFFNIMHKRKYWKLYRCLSSDEKKQAGRWLEAELYGKQQDVLKMYKALENAHSDLEVWKKIHPNRPFRDSSFRQTGFYLSEKLSDFISWQAFRQDDFMRDLYLLKGLNRRESGDLFPKSAKRIRKDFECKDRRDVKYYRALYELESENFHFLIKTSGKNIKLARDRLYKIFLHLYFQEVILRGISHLLTSNKTSENAHDILYLADWIGSKSLENDPVFSVHNKLFQLLNGKNADLYEIISELKDHTLKFGDRDSIANICILIINFLTVRILKLRDNDDFQMVNDFYSWSIERKWIFMDSYLPREHYKNILTLAFGMGKLDRIEQCIQEYIPLLPERLQPELKAFSEACYYFINKQYRRVYPLLNIGFTYPIDEIRARILALQARYELGEREDLLSGIRYFIAIVQREKSSE